MFESYKKCSEPNIHMAEMSNISCLMVDTMVVVHKEARKVMVNAFFNNIFRVKLLSISSCFKIYIYFKF
jgi:hypothetical protein